jgi:hypothetical protein
MCITGASLIHNGNSMKRQEILENRMKAIEGEGGEKMLTSYDMDAQTFISHARRRRFLKLVVNSLETTHKEIERERKLTRHFINHP